MYFLFHFILTNVFNVYIGSTYVLYGLGGLNWAAMTKTGSNDASASIVWAICLTSDHHHWTAATDMYNPTKRRSNSRRGSNDDDGVSRRICLEHPGMCFFFSHINLTNGYLNTRLHVQPKRWPSPPPRLV